MFIVDMPLSGGGRSARVAPHGEGDKIIENVTSTAFLLSRLLLLLFLVSIHKYLRVHGCIFGSTFTWE